MLSDIKTAGKNEGSHGFPFACLKTMYNGSGPAGGFFNILTISILPRCVVVFLRIRFSVTHCVSSI